MPRQLIEPRPDAKRYVRRKKGKFTSKQASVGRSLTADRRSKAKRVVKKGEGDRGDEAFALKKRSVKKLLRDTAVEIAEGEKLLAEKKRARKSARGKLKRRNAARSVKLIEKAVDSIEEHRSLLKRQAAARRRKPAYGVGERRR
jgi:hypothetical protein